MATTYILKCSDGKYYIGSCDNFAKRLNDHITGRCRTTKVRLPIMVLHTEDYPTVAEAKKREYQIKGWKSRSAIEKLVKYT